MSAAADRHLSLAPSAWVERFAPLIAPGARVLDLAAGTGRHAVFLAARGARVLAVDRDAAALASFAATPGVQTQVVDLEAGVWPFASEHFDAIVAVNYLHRPLFTGLLASLAGDGVLLYETFAKGNEAFGKPTNPDFLLVCDELLELARGSLTVVAFEQGAIEGECVRVVQRLAAVGRARRWPPALPV
jgi:SAM-dependent methyltransferase